MIVREKFLFPSTLRSLDLFMHIWTRITFSVSSSFSFVTLSRDARSNQTASLYFFLLHKCSKNLYTETLKFSFLIRGESELSDVFILHSSLNSPHHFFSVFSLLSVKSYITIDLVKLESHLQLPPTLQRNSFLQLCFSRTTSGTSYVLV